MLFILMVIENEPFKVIFGINVDIKSIERIVFALFTPFQVYAFVDTIV